MEEFLTSLLAGVAGGRRYWVRAPAGVERPYLVLQRIGAVRPRTIDGRTHVIEGRVQLDVWAESYTSARTTLRAALAAVDRQKGSYGTTTILGVFVEGENDLPGEDAGGASRLWRASADLIVHYRE